MKVIMSENPTIEEGFNYFTKSCLVKNLSKYTINSYQNRFNIFTKFYSAENLASTITSDLIDDYIIYLRERYDNPITIQSYIREIRVIIYFFIDNNFCQPFKINIPKAQKKIKETYSDAELIKLLKKPNVRKCNFTEFRTWALENYLLATGNRISSMLCLKIKDIDFDNQLISIGQTKNKRAQIIPMSDTLARVLKEYLVYRGGDTDDYLFCNSTGGKLNQRTCQAQIKKYNNNRGVVKQSAHLFRHTFAKKWILNGGDIFRLQKILGHSDITVVREYVNMFSTDLQRDFDKYNPLDTMQKTTVKMRS